MTTILDDESDNGPKKQARESETDRMWRKIDLEMYARLKNKNW